VAPLTLSQKSSFLDKLLSVYHGQIIASNILDGLFERLYGVNFVGELFKWWISLCAFKNLTTPNTIIAGLNILVFENLPTAFPIPNRPDFALICQRGTRLINNDEKLTTCVSSFIFSILISNDDLRILYSKGVEFPTNNIQPMKDDAISALMSLTEPERKVKLKDSAAIGNKGLVWYTLEERLNNALSRTPNKADEARDILGLVHRRSDDVMIAMHISSKVIKNTLNSRPTFADATTHPRFKTKADKFSNIKRSSWGHTAHLAFFAEDKQIIDGLPERVCSPIKQSHMVVDPEISYTPLGKVITTRGHDIVDDDKEYGQRLLNRRTIHEVKSQLLGII
jgi:hypothetical protein